MSDEMLLQSTSAEQQFNIDEPADLSSPSTAFSSPVTVIELGDNLKQLQNPQIYLLKVNHSVP